MLILAYTIIVENDFDMILCTPKSSNHLNFDFKSKSQITGNDLNRDFKSFDFKSYPTLRIPHKIIKCIILIGLLCSFKCKIINFNVHMHRPISRIFSVLSAG
jgi:hypothetical protein